MNYLVKIRLIVCKHLGCAKQATWSAWSGGEHVGDYCGEHGDQWLTEMD